MISHDLPLTDLHRHLDGNIEIATIIELARKYDVTLPSYTPEGLRPYVEVIDAEPGLLSFLAKLDIGVSVLGTTEACQRVAFENVRSAYIAGLDYVELRFSPAYMGRAHSLPGQAVVESVIEGVRRGTEMYPVSVQLIGILSRTFGPQACMAELEAILPYRQHVVGVDLAGDEVNFPCRLFSSHFARARDKGFHITVHAGEAAGPQSIREAIDSLGAERIGHGVQAIQDPLLLDLLARQEIAVECCLTSNIQTSTVNCLSEHPLKKFLDHGVIATLNTDDPAVEGIDIGSEYYYAAKMAALTKADCRQLQINGLKAAFINDAEKIRLIARKSRNTDQPVLAGKA